ncbi:MAG: sulfotransferase, partial [Actinomycetota bacterium]|nr:sulfotransferase [Actinomycetota bacterium]
MDIQTQICPNPVFIIGSPRSGTSILGWSLAHHSRFWTSNESHILFDLYGNGHVNRAFQIAKKRHSNGWLNVQGVETAEYLQYAGVGLNALFTSRSEGKRWVDHTPLHNHMVETLGEMFPEAFFLHILRDGRSVVNSMVNFLDRSAGDDPAPAWVDFTEACRTWRRYTEIAMDFGARNPTRCLTVVNEELVAEPVEGFRKILRFLDAPNEEGPANYFQTNRINSSFGAGSR